MSTRILIACSPGEQRVAVIRDDVLIDYAIHRPGAPDGVGDIHRGRILARVPAMAGAFVAIAGGEGFLPDTHGAAGRGEGDILAVRVTRAAQAGKGPRLRAVDMASDGPAPALLQRGPDAAERLAALHPGAPILIDDAATLRPVLGARPQLVRAAFDGTLANAVAALAEPSAEIPGGGILYVQPTRAVVAIDVDLGPQSGARARKGAAQRAANRALLPELARQIRLRNLSGAIVVDFAGMAMRQRAALGPDLQAALHDDPLRPRLLGFTGLGLAEILRPRVHPPLHELLAGPHAAGLAALRRLAAEIAADPARPPSLRSTPAVIAALRADAVALDGITNRAGRAPVLRADPTLPDNTWMLEPPGDRP